MLLISSEEPLVQVLSSTFLSKRHLTNLKRLLFLRQKYKSGIAPPKNWLIAVAAAAPLSPNGKTATKSASSTIFAIPAAAVTKRPSRGLPAVAKRH